jgi:hypothetical protein
MNRQDTIRASRDAGALGVGACVVVPTLALGAVDGRSEEPWLLLSPGLTHLSSPRPRTVMVLEVASSHERRKRRMNRPPRIWRVDKCELLAVNSRILGTLQIVDFDLRSKFEATRGTRGVTREQERLYRLRPSACHSSRSARTLRPG